MKKIISAILALAMCISFMGGITVSAAETKKEYFFASDSIGVINGYADYAAWRADRTNPDHDYVNSTANGGTINHTSLELIIGAGKHGFYFFDNSWKPTTQANNLYFSQVNGKEIRHNLYRSNSFTLEELSTSLVLVPPATAGFYKVSTIVTGTPTVYMGPRDTTKTEKNVEDYTNQWNYLGENTASSQAFNSGSYNDLSGKVIYSDSTTELILAYVKKNPDKATSNVNFYNRALKLTLVTGKPTFSISAQRLDTDETTDKLGNKATISVKLGDYNVANGFVGFTVPEEDKDIISVDKNGVVTALSAGTATVTATVGTYSKSFDIVVEDGINEIYYFGGNFVELNAAGYKNNPDIWDTTAINASVMQVKGFGNHGYKRIGYTYTRSDDLTTVSAHPYQTTPFAIRSNTTRSNSYTFDSLNCAIALEAPKKGFYTISISASKEDIPVYAAPYADNKTVDDYIKSEASLGKTYKGAAATTVATASSDVVFKALKPTSNIAVYSDGSTPIAFAYALEKGQSVDMNAVKLSKNNGEITYSAPDTIEKGNNSRVSVKIANVKLVDAFVNYSSSNPDVISINESGVMKAQNYGKATITAQIGDYPAFTKEITVPGEEEPEVPAEDPDYVAAFTPSETKKETVTTSVSALAIAKDGSSVTADKSASKNSDGTYTVSTDATSGEYSFLYWVKGLENGGKKRIVSFDASFKYAPHNGANYLIAVYGKSGDEATKNEYYNANGQLLENGEKLPSMAGYGTAKGWVDCGDGIFVAEYDDANVGSYEISVNGAKETYAYGDEVVCTANAEKNGEKFFGWKKTVNGKTAALVSASTTYKFYAWENCSVEAVYKAEKANFSGAIRKIVLGEISVGGKTAVMAEFIGLDNAVEKGITLGTADYAMSTDGTQFTIVNDVDATSISGYAILADGTKVIFKK